MTKTQPTTARGYTGQDLYATTNGVKFSVGRVHKCERAELRVCGFHICRDVRDLLLRLPWCWNRTRYYAATLRGGIQTSDFDSLVCGLEIKTTRELPPEEVVERNGGRAVVWEEPEASAQPATGSTMPSLKVAPSAWSSTSGSLSRPSPPLDRTQRAGNANLSVDTEKSNLTQKKQ